MTALSAISVRYFAAHKLRALITVAGIALGVGSVVGVRLMHASLYDAYERTIDRIAGKAVLSVSNGDLGVPEELLAEIQALPGVEAAAPSVQGFVALADLPGEQLYVFGIDLLADEKLREYESGSTEVTVDDPLVFLAQPNSVAVTTELAARYGLALDDVLRLLTPDGVRDLVIRAELAVKSGRASVFGGRVAVMDVFAAQRLFRLDGRFSQIDIGITPDAELAEVERAVAQVAGGRAEVGRPDSRGREVEQLLAVERYVSHLFGLVAVIVGCYLIFNTMTIAVAQRRAEFGVLRSVGARRRDLVRTVGLEAAAFGVLGSALGVPIGVALARAMSGSLVTAMARLYDVPLEVPAVGLSPGAVLGAVALGVGTAVGAGLAPARAAARVAPLEVLRRAALDAPAPRFWRWAAAGFAVVGLSAAPWLAGAWMPAKTAGNTTILGLLVGGSLIAPALVRTLVARSERVVTAVLGASGRLACRNLLARTERVAVTCAALVLSLAAALATATWLASFQQTLGLYFDTELADIDLVVTSGATPFASNPMPLPGVLADEIARLPQVAHANPTRVVRIEHEGARTMMFAAEGRLYSEGIRRLHLVEGDLPSALRRFAAGEAVLVNEAFARRFAKRPGDALSLMTPSGRTSLPIAAIYFDLTFADLGTVLLDRDLYRRLWHDDNVSVVFPILRAGADREATMEEIRRRWGAAYRVVVATMDQLRRDAKGQLSQTLLLYYPLVALAIAVALLGVVNSLLASIVERAREMGMLHAVGATRRQIVRVVLFECGLIGVLGGVLGVVLGSALGYWQIRVLFRGMFGLTVFYAYPAGAVAFALAAAPCLAAAAGYLPGRAAARLDVIEALRRE